MEKSSSYNENNKKVKGLLMMAETKKHDIVEHTCANCAYWEGQRLIDQASGISFINPNERATCSNQADRKSVV